MINRIVTYIFHISILAGMFMVTGCDFADHNAHGFEPSVVEAPDTSGWPPGLRFPMSLQVSSDFTTEEQDGIVQAVNRWKERTNGQADVTVFIGNNPEYPCRAYLVDSVPDGTDNTIGEAVGAGKWDKCNIELIRSQLKYISTFDGAPDYTTVVNQVVTHELGHVYGILKHLSDKKSIMYWSYDVQNLTLDDAAVNAFCKIRGCPDGMGEIQ